MPLTIGETIEQLQHSLRDYIEATYHISHPLLVAQRRRLSIKRGDIPTALSGEHSALQNRSTARKPRARYGCYRSVFCCLPIFWTSSCPDSRPTLSPPSRCTAEFADKPPQSCRDDGYRFREDRVLPLADPWETG